MAGNKCFSVLIRISKQTRMHSSRMRTGYSETVCWSLLPGGVCLVWGDCLIQGVCLVWGVVTDLGGVCLVRGVCLVGGMVSQHALRQTPPVNRMTNRCKNITLATTSLRPVMIRFQLDSHSLSRDLGRTTLVPRKRGVNFSIYQKKALTGAMLYPERISLHYFSKGSFVLLCS